LLKKRKKKKHDGDEQEEDKDKKMKKKEKKKDKNKNFAPLNQIHVHLCAFHFVNGDINRQVEAHHYCSHLSADVHQCVIYDSDQPHARLIGVEYIISERLFKQLPEEEQKLWHSHAYEVKSGSLISPHLPAVAENILMKELVQSYGKTIHTWQVDRGDPLPIGPPQVMMSFIADGQLDEDLLERRDRRMGLDTEQTKRQRENIKARPPHEGADSWRSGKAVQLTLKQIDSKPSSK